MDYLEVAFRDFNPQADHDAAMKFALRVIFLDERFDELSYLLTDGHAIGGVEGEPGWIIERRDTGPSGNMPGYAHWPKNTHFHAHVEEDVFALAYPDVFMTTEEFHDCVRKLIDVYVVKNPSKTNMAQPVISRLI